jgi:hypothetical protein
MQISIQKWFLHCYTTYHLEPQLLVKTEIVVIINAITTANLPSLLNDSCFRSFKTTFLNLNLNYTSKFILCCQI